MTQRRTGSRARPYYWIVADYNGQLVVIGPKDTAEEANQFAYENLDVEFEVKELQTRDRARATSILKANRLEETGNLGQALQRARHRPW